MARKGYVTDEVLRILRKNPAVKIDDGVIKVELGGNTVGNSTKGKLDYLSSYCGYSVIWLAEKEFKPKLKAAKSKSELFVKSINND